MLAARGRPRSAAADRAIAAATLALLEELGYARLTMAGVAERAGVSTATLYRRWSSKQDLVVAALTTLVPDHPPPDTGTLEGDLRETLRRIGESLSGDRGRLLLGLANEMIRHPALADAVQTRFGQPMQDNLGAMLDRAVQRGEIPAPGDTRAAIALIIGPLHYWLLSALPVTATMIEILVQMLLRALGSTAPVAVDHPRPPP